MTLAGIIEIISGVLKFPAEVRWLIQTLSKTPQERHQALLERIRKEADSFEETGRPTW